jgi:hypothetical protein
MTGTEKQLPIRLNSQVYYFQSKIFVQIPIIYPEKGEKGGIGKNRKQCVSLPINSISD